MNVEAADVERRLGTHDHAALPRPVERRAPSLGAGVAALASFLAVGRAPHLARSSRCVVLVGRSWSVRSFLPAELGSRGRPPTTPGRGRRPADGRARGAPLLPADAWREPRTLLIGVTMLGFALAEGIAGDWLAIAVVDSRGVGKWVGATMYGIFLASVMAGRFLGPVLLDRYGRYRPLLVMAGMVATGVLCVVFVPGVLGAALGAVLWGVGVSLGLPGRHDGRRRRPGQGRGPGVGGGLGRLHRLPGRPAPGRAAGRARSAPTWRCWPRARPPLSCRRSAMRRPRRGPAAEVHGEAGATSSGAVA